MVKPNVKGWHKRDREMKPVLRRLAEKMRKGKALTDEESKWYGDTVKLMQKHNLFC